MSETQSLTEARPNPFRGASAPGMGEGQGQGQGGAQGGQASAVEQAGTSQGADSGGEGAPSGEVAQVMSHWAADEDAGSGAGPQRADRYHKRHPNLVATFNELTAGRCAGGPAGVVYGAVRAWQAARGIDVDGMVGDETIAAARGPAQGQGGQAEAAPGAQEPAQGQEPAQAQEPAQEAAEEPAEVAEEEGGALSLAEAALAEAQKEEAPAAKPAKKKENKAGSGGPKKTNGPKDLVETYGTVEEADKLRESVTVYWVDGLKTKKVKGQDKKTEEERDDVDELPMKSQGIPVHKKIAPLFREIFEEIKAQGDWKNILERPWSLNARQNRNNTAEWSIHSWGTAIDVNPTTNPNGRKGGTERQDKIASYFTSRGFVWLEDTDAMHFQYHTGGAPQISNDELAQIKDGKHPGTSKKSLLHDLGADLKKTRARLAKEEKRKKPREKKLSYLRWKITRMEEMTQLLKGEEARPAVAQEAQEP